MPVKFTKADDGKIMMTSITTWGDESAPVEATDEDKKNFPYDWDAFLLDAKNKQANAKYQASIKKPASEAGVVAAPAQAVKPAFEEIKKGKS